MGSKSSSSSSSSNTTKTVYDDDIYDTRGVFEQGSIGSTAGDVNIDAMDPSGLDLAKELGGGAFDLAGQVMTGAREIAEETMKQSLDLVAEASEDNAKEIAQTTIKSLLVGGVAVAALWVWGNKK